MWSKYLVALYAVLTIQGVVTAPVIPDESVADGRSAVKKLGITPTPTVAEGQYCRPWNEVWQEYVASYNKCDGKSQNEAFYRILGGSGAQIQRRQLYSGSRNEEFDDGLGEHPYMSFIAEQGDARIIDEKPTPTVLRNEAAILRKRDDDDLEASSISSAVSSAVSTTVPSSEPSAGQNAEDSGDELEESSQNPGLFIVEEKPAYGSKAFYENGLFGVKPNHATPSGFSYSCTDSDWYDEFKRKKAIYDKQCEVLRRERNERESREQVARYAAQRSASAAAAAASLLAEEIAEAERLGIADERRYGTFPARPGPTIFGKWGFNPPPRDENGEIIESAFATHDPLAYPGAPKRRKLHPAAVSYFADQNARREAEEEERERIRVENFKKDHAIRMGTYVHRDVPTELEKALDAAVGLNQGPAFRDSFLPSSLGDLVKAAIVGDANILPALDNGFTPGNMIAAEEASNLQLLEVPVNDNIGCTLM
ncbi:hypothetical protein BJ508DRAFT_340701 [Ascobolus immersus RN42]|uniref:Uncharacterized protein n=1 Tax=Ascobolus immersus RN42 TaxID=1160509 RepID=A0A3N4IJ52_ASCIM|nr:hypothetical protein BJ508DRAFT_340701 [Ascobolus immersus RN42]